MEFRFLGFDIRLDFSFLLIGILFYGLFSTVGLVLFLVASGFTVLMHELGHAITARQVGGQVLSVNLQGFGGFTQWLPNDSVSVMQRFWVAAAGPLYQLALGAILYGAILAGALGQDWGERLGSPLNWTVLQLADLSSNWGVFIVLSLAILSVVWAVFNLVPIFGLDGYTMVRQLAFRVSPSNGDTIAKVIGLIVSIGLIAFFALRGAIFGAAWVGYIAFTNYPSATRRELPQTAEEQMAASPEGEPGGYSGESPESSSEPPSELPSLFDPPDSSDGSPPL